MIEAGRKASAAALAVALVVGLGACGDDDDSAADDATGQAGGEGAGQAGDERVASDGFCDGVTALDGAFSQMPEDPGEMEAWIGEQVTPNVEAIKADLPDDADLSEAATTMTETVEQVTSTGDPSALESPEFAAAQGVLYPALGDACGLQSVTATAVDYGFEGVPEALDAGTTVFVIDNVSEAGEAHEIGFARVKDGVDASVEELLALPEDELESKVEIGGGTYAPAGQRSGTTIDLSPGRYVYVCFIPVGSVDGAEGSGPPHIAEGMYGEFTVS